jgi:hypothetical protein
MPVVAHAAHWAYPDRLARRAFTSMTGGRGDPSPLVRPRNLFAELFARFSPDPLGDNCHKVVTKSLGQI